MEFVCSSSSCEYSKIYLSANSTKVVGNCNSYGCRYMQLFADPVPFIDLFCTGAQSCVALQLYQQNPPSIMSMINIDCSASTSCASSIIKSNSHQLTINCSFSKACSNANIFYNPNLDTANATIYCAKDACSRADIFAVEGIYYVLLCIPFN